MLIAKVIGSAVASVKLDALKSSKLLVVSPADGSGDVNGAPFLAVDLVGAGEGNWWWSARAARPAWRPGQTHRRSMRRSSAFWTPCRLTGMLLSGRNRRMVDASANEEMILGDEGLDPGSCGPWA